MSFLRFRICHAPVLYAGLGLLLVPATVGAQGATQEKSAASSVAAAGNGGWPAMPKAALGAPNVLVIMTDDAGFASSSTFGGPVPTPTFDALARVGLRYNRFHTTALCSPTRAALLTGRNPHNVEMGTLTNTPRGESGYTTVIPKSAGTIADTLRRNGYVTAAFGKWHLTPEWESSQAGPFDHWPTQMGFNHFYGFLDGSTDQWAPSLFENTTPIDLPVSDPNYILDRDLADRTINWIREQRQIAPDRPFFAYYATGTAHSPHHAPKAWLDRFRGKFDQGWDAMREQTLARQKAAGIVSRDTRLTPRPAGLPAWSSLSADEKRIATRLMEAFAASLAFADNQIGRVIESLRQSGQLDNTLVIYIQGDNGGSGEGGPEGLLYEESFVHGFKESRDYVLRNLDKLGGPFTASNYPAGWGWAMNTPFQYYKQVASHFGGTRNGMVLSWPKRIKRMGEIRSQFHFVSDIAPTILEAANIEAPADLDGIRQKPLDGISMAYSFDQPTAPSRRRTQAFEMVQNLGIYHDGWWAGTTPVKAPWELLKGGATDNASRRWELYDLSRDFSQSRDLATANPQKLAEMRAIFEVEAKRNNIDPLQNPGTNAAGRPAPAKGRSSFLYYPGLIRVPESAAPQTIGHSFSITANVVIPENGAEGVLLAQGGRFGGYSFYLKGDRPVFHYNAVGERQYSVRATAPLSSGAHQLIATFAADGPQRGAPGTVTLSVDGRDVARGRVEQTLVTWISHTEGLDVGEDKITPVSEDYSVQQSKFSGELKGVLVKLN